MQTDTITYDGPGNPLSVTVSEATVLQGMKRNQLIAEALATLQTSSPKKNQKTKGKGRKKERTLRLPRGDDWSLFLLRRYTWPNCISATVESSFETPLTFEKFCSLPERFVAQWEAAVLKLNPHWQIGEENEEAEAKEKKDESASGSE